MKVITHLHTHYSYDCLASPKAVVLSAVDAGADIALICDHDNFAGSRVARNFVSAENINIFIPIAAEILTEYGDVIIAFDHDHGDLKVTDLKHFDRLLQCARGLNGVVILPHPFVSHQGIYEIVKAVDAVEAFNGRCAADLNARATTLCTACGKPRVYAADAHFLVDVGSVIAEYYDDMRSVEVFRKEPSNVVACNTYRYRIALSALIKDIKLRRVSRFPHDLGWSTYLLMREKVRGRSLLA
jgi:predicted metal-dependent phosphoesterase TrpH